MKFLSKMNLTKKSKTILLFQLVALFSLSLVIVSCDEVTPDPNEGNEQIEENEDPNTTLSDDFEPNDERSQAHTIDLDAKYSTEISKKSDDDWFMFTTAHGSDTYDNVQISVTDASQDLCIRISLYLSDGKAAGTGYASSGGQDYTFTFAAPGGDYYVRFSGDIGYDVDHQSAGNYSFTVSNLDANDDFAPNHTFETAEESLEYDNSYDGVLVSKNEDDYYKFTNPSPGTWNSYTISLTNVSSDLFGSIERYNAQKSSLDRKNSGTAGADLSYSLIENDDEFYVRISGDIGYGIDHGSRGSYTLSVVLNGNDDYEPDDTFEDAREINAFPVDLNGTLLTTAANDNNGDYEFFKVTITDQKKVSWSVDPEAANTELHFRVYDANKEYIGIEDGSDGQTINGSMSNSTGTDSFFYIELGCFRGDNGNYSIAFTESDLE